MSDERVSNGYLLTQILLFMRYHLDIPGDPSEALTTSIPDPSELGV
jgi:hypothetical protein